MTMIAEPTVKSQYLETAREYLASGLCTLPANGKKPHGTWKEFQADAPSAEVLEVMFEQEHDGIGVLTGRSSGNLEALDFDCGGEVFPDWLASVEAKDAALAEKLVIEETPSGGTHVVYRCSAVAPNQKLARKEIIVEKPGKFEYAGNVLTAQARGDGQAAAVVTLIETRGLGGWLRTAPSPDYNVIRGDWRKVQTITPQERAVLIEAAKALNAFTPPPTTPPPSRAQPLTPSGSWTDARVRAYMAKVPIAVSGQDGHSQTLKAAFALVRGFGMSIDEARPYLEEYSSRCEPPWKARELEHKLNEAEKLAGPDRGYLLVEPGPDWGAKTTPQPERGDMEAQHDQQPERPTFRTPSQIMAYKPTESGDCLLGARWLCKGGSSAWVGQTGIGKSSLATQAMSLWALGRPLFGITPSRPLKSLCFQAENDEGDLCEQMSGVIYTLGLQHEIATLDRNVQVAEVVGKVGKTFVDMLEREVIEHQPDLVWIDPLFGFFGSNINDQEAMTRFLRTWLNPILKRHGCAAIICHHTGKPLREPNFKKGTLEDMSYLGMGSSELPNWARAALSLREVEDGVFELAASKRGKRAGLKTPDGDATRIAHIQHAPQAICWEYAINRHLSADQLIDVTVSDIIETLEPDRTYQTMELAEFVKKFTGKGKSVLYKDGTDANKVFMRLRQRTEIHPNMFRKGGNEKAA